MIAADEFGGQQAAELSEWVTTLCRQYSQATGWTIRFVAEAAGPLSRESLATDVVAANRRVGRIELLLGSDVDQVTRERARATTQLLVRVIEEMVVSRQDVAQRTNQLRTMVALGQTTATNGDVEETLTGLLRGGGRGRVGQPASTGTGNRFPGSSFSASGKSGWRQPGAADCPGSDRFVGPESWHGRR